MEFNVNHPILFVIAGLLIAVVLAQSVYFLVKALRRSKALGMDQTGIRKTIRTAAIFTIAPAVAIVISIIAAVCFLTDPVTKNKNPFVPHQGTEMTELVKDSPLTSMGVRGGKLASSEIVEAARPLKGLAQNKHIVISAMFYWFKASHRACLDSRGREIDFIS